MNSLAAPLQHTACYFETAVVVVVATHIIAYIHIQYINCSYA